MAQISKNELLKTDAYKLSHPVQYPSDLTYLMNYGEVRNSSEYDWTVFAMFQGIIANYFEGQRFTLEDIVQAQEYSECMFGTRNYFDAARWRYVYDKTGGVYPIRIRAVPEGKIVNKNNVLFTFESLLPEFACLMGGLETRALHVWYPIAVATSSLYIQKSLYPIFKQYGDPQLLPYVVHDFGYRGVTCDQQAQMGGAANLLIFHGSDTLAGDTYLMDHYGEGPLKSVMASEHSVATCFGRDLGEKEYIHSMLDSADDALIVSIVSDSYNVYEFAEKFKDSDLNERIQSRDGRVVLRLDSGDPFEVCIKVLNSLEEGFGCTHYNGLKMLNYNVGILQGDGMNKETIPRLYQHLVQNNWSPMNLVVGSGTGLLNSVNRDTVAFAIKACYAERESIGAYDVRKDPITASGKSSKAGKLKLIPGYTQGKLTDYRTVAESDSGYENAVDMLETVFENGEFVKKYSYKDVQANLHRTKFFDDAY